MSKHQHTDECTGDRCGFRLLYESSQASLADMSARQGQALARVGRLRAGVATSIRRNFPQLSSQAEQQMGSRMSDVDDEILLAYLDAFTGHTLSEPTGVPPAEAIDGLRGALLAVGIPVQGDDPAQWVATIREYGAAQSAAAPHSMPPSGLTLADALLTPLDEDTDDEITTGSEMLDAHPATPEPQAKPRPALPTLLPPSSNESVRQPADTPRDKPPADEPPEPGPTAQGATSTSLGNLFADVAVDLWDGPLGDIEEPDGRWSPSPVRARAAEDMGPADGAAVPPAKSRRGRKSRSAKRSKSNAQGAATAHDAVEEPTESASQEGSHEPAQSADPQAAGPNTPPVQESPAPGQESERIQTDTSAEASIATVPDDDSGLEDFTFDDEPPTRVHQTPLRPQIAQSTPAGGRKRKGRALRTQAQAPEELTLYPSPAAPPSPDSESRDAVVLSDELTTALVAAASIPRPVFTRDLVEIAGSADLVEQWESTCRADPATYPVRFIAPKMRHRPRGSLVFADLHPVSAVDAWWQRCLTTYRGARLYELAVLLHRVGDEIVSSRFTEDAALLRLSTGKGLVGIIVTFDTAMEPGQSSREALETFMNELLAERLVLIAVLTTNGEAGAVNSLVATLGDLALSNAWSPSAPVVAARSWEYADNRGTTSVLALGG